MDYHRRSAFFFIPLFIIGFSCTPKKEKVVTRSYYYWRSSGEIGGDERKFLRDHQIKKLYVRLMDIDWSGVQGAIPVSAGQPGLLDRNLNEYDSLGMDIIPVIFITNQTFEKIDSADIPLLARRVVRRCLPAYDEMDKVYESKHRQSVLGDTPLEIQIDCDWTTRTRNKYFYFLNLVKEFIPPEKTIISATIRLHQYKYPEKTGIPPVNRGMLMLYNITDLRSYSPVNSIYEDKKAKAYFTPAKKYALPLDIVLPAYSWCILFRDRQFYQIENDLSENELKQQSFLQPAGKGFYRVTADTVFQDMFLRPGDEIKVESISAEVLRQAAELSEKAINTDKFSVAFFELSVNEIKNYNHETFEDIYHSFR